MFKLFPGRQWLALDERVCIRFNRAARYEPVRQIFSFGS